MSHTVKIGTRGSKLALWQAYHVEELLQKAGLATQIVIIDTKGDQVLDVSISKIGSKGVFTQELEDQLLDRRIDIAVHSAAAHVRTRCHLILVCDSVRTQPVQCQRQKRPDQQRLLPAQFFSTKP